VKKTYQQILDDAVRSSVPENVDLSKRVRDQISWKPAPRPRLGLAQPAVLILLVLGVLSLVTGVVYAVGRSLGYIPGVGFVETTPRQLMTPVTDQKDGITLTISQGYLTNEKTILVYQFDNISREVISQEETEPGCFELPFLILPDGETLQVREFSGTFNEFRAEFPPIPDEFEQANLELPCVPHSLPGLAPENWRISLSFGEGEPTLISVPVQEIDALPQEEGSESPPASIQVTKSILVGNQFVILGEIKQPQTGDWISVDDIRVRDAVGENVTTQYPSLFDLPAFDWGVQFEDQVQLPLTLEIDWVELRTIPDAAVDFRFDAGDNPQPGQEWNLNQAIEVGGYSITLSKIQANTRGGYTFFFKDAPEVRGLIAQLTNNEDMSGGGGGGGGSAPGSGEFSAGFSALSLPKGEVDVTFSNLTVESKSETRKISWDAEGLFQGDQVPGDEGSDVCLTETQWTQLPEALASSSILLEGQFLTAISEGDLLPMIYLKDSDGMVEDEFNIGAWSALSRDGDKLAYSDGSGIHMLSRSDGRVIDFGRDGFRMIWSPDSSQLMFASSGYLYVSDPLGSNQQIIDTEASQIVIPVGWLPDNSGIVYSFLSGGGFQLVQYDLETGLSNKLFLVHNKDGFGEISPDGEWIVYLDQDSELDVRGLYISQLDGSDRRLVANLNQIPAAIPVIWSPDNNWLSISIYEAEGPTISILLNPFTCQAFVSPVEGQVTGWIR